VSTAAAAARRALLGAALLLAARAATAGSGLELFPAPSPYPPYVADPRRPEFAVALLGLREAGIADSGERRVGLKLGGRFALLRFHRGAAPDGGVWFDIEAGFVGQFDVEHSLDNVGWDGTYGFLFSKAFARGLSVQLGSKHVSSHVGDEYAERTGRRRIGYTRDEAVVGAAWPIDPRRRLYAEVGWGLDNKDDIGQRPGRLQLGVVHEAPASLGGGRLGWFVALDLGALEERDWQVDPTLQAGLLVPAGSRRWRVSVDYHQGSVPLGEFFADDERWLGLALRLAT
jgi:hypothetical protein